MKLTQSSVLEFTEAFPPAHKLTETLMTIDYKKHYNSFMDGVENVVVFLMVIGNLLIQKWNENDMTEKTQLLALSVYEWIKEVGIPQTKEMIIKTYTLGVKSREVYEVLTARQFVTF